ncbi:MAG: MauE/DoxX family redox-associated membrane protein [Cyclobacteriaceae bacterium]
MIKRLLREIISFLFIFLFAYAAVNKLLDYAKFKLQLEQSPILTSIADIVAVGIPVAEFAIVLMLLFRKTRLLGLYFSFSLMVAFTTYIILILNFSFYVPCLCGGVLENMGWTQHLFFNITFSILGIVGIALETSDRSYVAVMS